MMINYLYAFISVLVVSLVSLVGVFSLSLREDVLKKYISFFISLAIGALLGDAFLHIIPEAFEGELGVNLSSILIIVGILLFFVTAITVLSIQVFYGQQEQSVKNLYIY